MWWSTIIGAHLQHSGLSTKLVAKDNIIFHGINVLTIQLWNIFEYDILPNV